MNYKKWENPMERGTASMLTREQQRNRERRDDIWVEWSGTGGTFTIHRNGGFPVFPLTREESLWVRRTIADVYNLGQYIGIA
jgi:hypothetical protein